MPGKELAVDGEIVASFERRRRSRKYRMIVELTEGIIASHPRLSYRQAECLIACARRSIGELSPAFAAEFELTVVPELEACLQERWPDECSTRASSRMLVN